MTRRLAPAALLAAALALLAASCGGGDGSRNLAALAGEALEGVTAKVTYTVITDVSGQRFDGEWVLVQRPPDFRFEIAGEEAGRSFRTIAITAGGATYLCFASAGEESCLSTGAEAAEAETAPFEAILDAPRDLVEEAEDIEVVGESRRQFAGVDANCFTFTSAVSDLGGGEVCFSDEGLLLFLQSEGEGGSSFFEATSVSLEVTDEDFEPPFEVTGLDAPLP